MRPFLLFLPLLLGCPADPKPMDTGVLEYADADGDGYDERTDCDDGDADIHPGAAELCNGQDDDCDGFVDDEDPGLGDGQLWYADVDGDGFGDAADGVTACEVPDGYVDDASDCDDADAAVFPGADEACNGVDDDCDGEIDEGSEDMSTFWADLDGDGFGDPGSSTEACAAPDGYVADATDCDDADAAVNPEAVELCNDRDDDCDGLIDEDIPDTSTWYTDADGDGYGDPDSGVEDCAQPEGTVADATDCDDADASISPVATERCDGIDNDCDGLVDDEDDSVAVTSTWYADADGDGYGVSTDAVVACDQPSGYAALSGDCDDVVASVNPGASEHCDGVDEDCDGVVDDAAVDLITWYADTDGDAYGDPHSAVADCYQPTGYVTDSSDCDDTTATTYPGADEYCNGVDDDCNGIVDDNALDQVTWYTDADGDAYGDHTSTTIACSQPSGSVADDTDCDDGDATVNPGASETCNGVDDDCDGAVDEGAPGSATWYSDADGDGYGDTSTAVTTCTPPSGTVSTGGDCDDSDASINPGASETCDGVDEDCDGVIDDGAPGWSTWYDDLDGDGYGDTSSAVSACSAPTGMIATGGDCDDTSATINPAATEYCDGVDTDCDGVTDPGSTVSFENSSGVFSDVTSTFTLSSTSTPSTYGFSSSGTLYFCAGSYEGFIDVSAATAAIVGVDGSGATELSGAGLGTVITALSGASQLEVSGMTLLEGAGSNGGAISSAIVGLDFYAEDLVVFWSAATNGGALYLKDADTISLQQAEFYECAATKGGAIFIDEGTLDLDDLLLQDNAATDRGGAVHIKDALGTGSGWQVDGNVCSNKGGGLFIEDTTFDLSDSEIYDNLSTSKGGGIILKGGADLSMTTTIVRDNVSALGGGIFVDNSTATCTGTSTSASAEGFQGNYAALGGGVYVKAAGGSFTASTCDMGTGSDDNTLDDVYVESGATTYSYGDDESFECDESSCW